MTQEEINEKIESFQKMLEDYNVQLEALSRKDDITEDEQAEFEFILKHIETITEELDSLLDLL
jgi:hypothetical protein